MLATRENLRTGLALSSLAAAAQFLVVWLLWPAIGRPASGAAISAFLAIVAFLCGVNGTLNVSRLGRRALMLYALGYAALFIFFMLYLEGHVRHALIFPLFALFFASMFHFGPTLGYLAIVLIAYFLFPLHALPVMLLLALYYTLFIQVVRAARKADNYLLIVFFALSLLFAAIVFFPLLHFVVQRTPQDLVKTFFDKVDGAQVREAIGRSLYTSTISTAITLVLGLPLAYVLVRADFKGRAILDVAIDIPIMIPPPIIGIAILMLVGSSTSIAIDIRHFFESIGGLFGGQSTAIGRWFHGVKFEGAVPGIIFAQVLVSSPFLIRSAMTAFRGVDPRLEYVSRTLGAGPLGTFRRITLPLAGRGLFTGCILAWGRSISEFGSIHLIAQNPPTGPTLIYTLFSSKGGTPGPAASVAIIMALVSLSIFIMLHVLGSRMIWRRD